MDNRRPTIGVIGGSGLYDMPGLQRVDELTVDTPFGPPSDVLVRGWLGDTELVFVPRHGRGHRLSPSDVPYRANIYALRQLGVDHVLSISAVGSLREDIRPGDLVVVDQFVDRTRRLPATFFGTGLVVHVGFGDPVCGRLRQHVVAAAAASGKRVHDGGTYVCMEGPAFSTRAESNLYRSWGMDVVGMTNIPEAKLAREAELCFSTLALATDYDCWHESEEDVSVESVLATLRTNTAAAREVVRALAAGLPAERTCGCSAALDGAILTQRDAIAPGMRAKLELLVGRYL